MIVKSIQAERERSDQRFREALGERDEMRGGLLETKDELRRNVQDTSE
jgi:hypothetical protein